MDQIELIENTYDNDNVRYLNCPKLDGKHAQMLHDHLCETKATAVVNGIFANAHKALPYFAAPCGAANVTKILCLGKVQSGKTAFFISVISLAFDNGYDVVYVLGGTKNSLRDQNFERVSFDLGCDPDIVVVDLNKSDKDVIKHHVDCGQKVVAVALKNPAEKRNIGKLKETMQFNYLANTLIIDDEGDEHTPGAPKRKVNNPRAGRTHDAIAELLPSAQCVTYMAVTATPQANMLLSTLDELSPEHIVLVEPGVGYTGGNSFHDTSDNVHTVEISDADDFVDSIPESFINALYYFIFTCALKVAGGDDRKFSMLVHPSSLTAVHDTVASRIEEAYESISNNLCDSKNITYEDECAKIKALYEEYIKDNPECDVAFESVLSKVDYVLKGMQVVRFNAASGDYFDDDTIYKIYVGGNMLGRGLTIENLSVTYMYREAKEMAIDTLYQRARWFGYKQEYFDVCRVYLTRALKQAFINIVDSENDMWNAVRAFLYTNINLKQFPRVFRLDNDRLILTRKTIAKTITLQRVNPGYSYNKSVLWGEDEKESNRTLYSRFMDKWQINGNPRQFGNNSHQTHFIIDMKFSDFFNDFLCQYIYPKETNFGVLGFKKMLNDVNNGVLEDKVSIVIMRYKSKQFRSLSASKYSIKELPQSYDSGTQYPGDKCLDELMDQLHFQIHLVYTVKDDDSDYMPMLAMNNPITKYSARYVTGDNYYEAI